MLNPRNAYLNLAPIKESITLRGHPTRPSRICIATTTIGSVCLGVSIGVRQNSLARTKSSFVGRLNEHGAAFKAEVIAGAMKRHFVMEIRALMKARGLGVNALQKRLGTGPSQVQRRLNRQDTGISLKSIVKVLAVLGPAGQIAVEVKQSKKEVA